MTSASEIVSAVFGMTAAAFVIWTSVRVINDRRLPKIAFPSGVVGACLWLPFSWLVLMHGGWDSYRWTWFRLWPILPGFLPGAILFHPRHEALEFSTMAVVTLILLGGLTWLGYRSRTRLIFAAVTALLISIPTACITYGLYWF